jgi:hypothetical protein
VSRQLGWDREAEDLVDFSEKIAVILARGEWPILLQDEAEAWFTQPKEFTHKFRMTLRACCQKGLSIVTATRKLLSDLTDQNEPDVSAFYNIFPHVPLGSLTAAEAAEMIQAFRPGVPAFTDVEQAAIREFAAGHPLGLQVGCFHVLEAKQYGESVALALRRADEEMTALLPTWRAGSR